jgi:uncharacterized membrane protein YpjA
LPKGRLFTVGSFFEIFKIFKISFWAIFIAWVLTNNGLDYILGNFFLQTHLVTLEHARDDISKSGANPTIASYNASIVKTYSAVNSLARF